MRWWKLLLALTFLIIVFIETICIGWAAAALDQEEITIHALGLVYSLYLLIAAVRSVKQETVDTHSESIMHIAALTFWAVMLLGTTAIFPNSPSPVEVTAQLKSYPALRGLWYAVLALYFIACAISSTAPQGPQLHFNPKDIYSAKTVAATTNVYANNVCGITSKPSPFLTLAPNSY